MCDHYDSYYRMTPEEEKENERAKKKEAERVAKFRRDRELRMAREYSKQFSVSLTTAIKEVQKIKFVMEWNG